MNLLASLCLCLTVQLTPGHVLRVIDELGDARALAAVTPSAGRSKVRGPIRPAPGERNYVVDCLPWCSAHPATPPVESYPCHDIRFGGRAGCAALHCSSLNRCDTQFVSMCLAVSAFPVSVDAVDFVQVDGQTASSTERSTAAHRAGYEFLRGGPAPVQTIEPCRSCGAPLVPFRGCLRQKSDALLSENNGAMPCVIGTRSYTCLRIQGFAVPFVVRPATGTGLLWVALPVLTGSGGFAFVIADTLSHRCLTIAIEPAQVKRVIDGDTFVIFAFNVPPEERVRVLNIDTPERGDALFESAKNFTAQWLARGPFTLHACKRDSFGRLLADLTRPDDSLADALFAAHLGARP
jgi:hypothetical protein